SPATAETVANKEHFARQEGAHVLKFAVNNRADVSVKIMEKDNLTAADVDRQGPHQANERNIEPTDNKRGQGSDKGMMSIDEYGNTTAATIPLCLWDYESQLKKGDNLVLAAFGGGFTWGSIYLKWGYDPK